MDAAAESAAVDPAAPAGGSGAEPQSSSAGDAVGQAPQAAEAEAAGEAERGEAAAALASAAAAAGQPEPAAVRPHLGWHVPFVQHRAAGAAATEPAAPAAPAARAIVIDRTGAAAARRAKRKRPKLTAREVVGVFADLPGSAGDVLSFTHKNEGRGSWDPKWVGRFRSKWEREKANERHLLKKPQADGPQEPQSA